MHLHFSCLRLHLQHVLHNPCASSVLHHIRLSQSPLSTFRFDFDFGQWPRDGPLVGHCSVCSFSTMTTSWGPAGGVGWTFEASMLTRWKANIVSIPEIPLCVDVFDGGALSSSWDSMFVDSRREAFVRACHYKRQFALLPALLSFTVVQCSYLKWWAVGTVMFLFMLMARLHGQQCQLVDWRTLFVETFTALGN